MKRSPLKPVSAKTKARAADRKKVIEFVHRRDHQCQFWHHAYGVLDHTQVPAACVGPLDVHEIIPRSVWPAGKYEPTNCVLICRRHHQWVTEHPNDAALVGLHDWSWGRRGVDDA